MLRRLSRRFDALLAEEQLAGLLDQAASARLIGRSVLQLAGESESVSRCICPLQRPTCVVQVEGDGDPRTALCAEYGQPLIVPRSMVRHYRFSWPAWAAAVRSANDLQGPEPQLGDGALLIGDGVIAGRAYRVVAVAPGCGARQEVVVPERAGGSGTALILLCLGDHAFIGGHGEIVLGRRTLADDLLTLDASGIERMLAGSPLVVTTDEQKYCVFSDAFPKGKVVGEDEYLAMRSADSLKGIDIFVDVTVSGIWRGGRACTKVLDKNGKPTSKRLTQRAVRVAAAYVRRPGIAMRVHESPAYSDRAVDPRSAAVMFSLMRRSIRGSQFLLARGAGDSAGNTQFVFEPQGMSWRVVERPDASGSGAPT